MCVVTDIATYINSVKTLNVGELQTYIFSHQKEQNLVLKMMYDLIYIEHNSRRNQPSHEKKNTVIITSHET